MSAEEPAFSAAPPSAPMRYEEKLKLLKALNILRHLPERQLAALAEFLRPRRLDNDMVLFKEGSMGMSLYFVSSGRILISKRAGESASKNLAVLGPGEFFGENALIEEASRSATASSLGPCVVFELFRGDLARWVKSNPLQAVQFFAELVHVQSERLRRTSSELTLQFDMADLFFAGAKALPALLTQALQRAILHLEGTWSAAALLRSEANGALELAASAGDKGIEEAAKGVAESPAPGGTWLDASTFHVPLAGRSQTAGSLVFRAQSAVGEDRKDEIARALAAVARPIAAAVELHRS